MRVDEIKRMLVSQREEMEEFVRRERIVPRESENNIMNLMSLGGILAILGVRRSGKSILSWMISGRRRLYVNFFDERLSDFKSGDFERLLSAARQL